MLEKESFKNLMVELDLNDTQNEAVKAVFNAIARNEHKIIIEMVSGSGKAKVLQTVAKILDENSSLENSLNNVLIVVRGKAELKQYTKAFQLAKIDYIEEIRDEIYPDISIVTQRAFLQDISQSLIDMYNYIICDDIYTMNADRYIDIFGMSDATIIGFTPPFPLNSLGWLYGVQPVYSNVKHFHNEIDALHFLTDIFHYNGMEEVQKERKFIDKNLSYCPDIIMQKDNRFIVVEVKTYRSINVSSTILEDAVVRIRKYQTEITESFSTRKNHVSVDFCLIAFCLVEPLLKERFLKQYNIHVLDVANLLYLSQNNLGRLEHLAQLLPYSIENIPYIEPDQSLFGMMENMQKSRDKAEDEAVADDLIIRLDVCQPGKTKKAYLEFEHICTDIVNYLFASEFSKKVQQHKTSDNLFRMDMLCALKGTTAFWRFLIKFYNTNFVVFEYKNYKDQISQNLIYTTEKYLFDAALRNVAFIISREGFDAGAKSAALGSLKEHKKLIIDLTDQDLIYMIKMKKDGEDPSDYMLSKLEDYLMSIGK